MRRDVALTEKWRQGSFIAGNQLANPEYATWCWTGGGGAIYVENPVGMVAAILVRSIRKHDQNGCFQSVFLYSWELKSSLHFSSV